MSESRIGIWLIGAWGGVATTAATGLAALQHGLTDEAGLVSSLSPFSELDLAQWSQFVVGGHEIRRTTYEAEARVLHQQSRVFTPEILNGVEETLAGFDKNIRTGTLFNVGDTICSFASAEAMKTRGELASDAISRLQADYEEFQKKNNLDHVIVLNVSSTEPAASESIKELNWDQLSQKLTTEEECGLPASSLYAIAAIQAGFSFVNFTPSIGSDIPALEELAEQKKTLHVGRDGKTGETLMKAVLAPMFARRNLPVMSWVGHNIFGNLDGKVLDDPVNKANKVTSKDHLLTEILGYSPQTLVSIEYIKSMGDWKTAWDHIHFQGFLNTPMTLQFTWQGCDSLLAAPLVLDLARLTEREWRRGKSGVMSHLSSFFKSPMKSERPEFDRQFQLLEEWAAEVAQEE